jgi:hypothetical protein
LTPINKKAVQDNEQIYFSIQIIININSFNPRKEDDWNCYAAFIEAKTIITQGVKFKTRGIDTLLIEKLFARKFGGFSFLGG